MIRNYLEFLLSHSSYSDSDPSLKDEYIEEALDSTFQDVAYNYPGISFEQVVSRISSNQNELALFIFRLGNIYFNREPESGLIYRLNSVNKVFANCEIYFSNEIGTGFNIVHGIGTVIGSRNKIGKGFMIYQNCTVGHFNDFEKGATIGNDVTLFSGSQIIGEVSIGDCVIVGGNSLVNSSVPAGAICVGSPAKVINFDAKSKLSGFRANYR